MNGTSMEKGDSKPTEDDVIRREVRNELGIDERTVKLLDLVDQHSRKSITVDGKARKALSSTFEGTDNIPNNIIQAEEDGWIERVQDDAGNLCFAFKGNEAELVVLGYLALQKMKKQGIA